MPIPSYFIQCTSSVATAGTSSVNSLKLGSEDPTVNQKPVASKYILCILGVIQVSVREPFHPTAKQKHLAHFCIISNLPTLLFCFFALLNHFDQLNASVCSKESISKKWYLWDYPIKG